MQHELIGYITEMVYCAVRTEYLKVIHINSGL